MKVAEAVGRALAGLGVDTAFGVVGSGNFHLTNAMVAAGVRFVAARHECGAAVMADAYARTSGRLGVLSVHQGPGVTNALTGVAEAAKSRTPMVVLAPDTGAAGARSNFRLDQAALVAGIGAVYERAATPDSAVDDAVRAVRRARAERRTVVLGLPLDVQAGEASDREPAVLPPEPAIAPAPESVAGLAELLVSARRPVFIAGRGARGTGAAPALVDLADRCGALLATSAVAKGLFNGNPWYLDVSGGFASPLAAELITDADLVVAWGCALNMWTTRHGRLLGPQATVAQVDIDADALGANPRVRFAVLAEATATARAVDAELARRGYRGNGYRDVKLRERIATEVRWRDIGYADESTADRIDPRTLSIRLDDLLPAERVVAIDSGNFMGYPSMYLSVPDAAGFCFTQAFQSIGLGLATAIGAAVARPDRLPVAALGDGGFLMGVAELETVARLGLPMVIVVYDDSAYGAEVHHFGPDGYPLDTVTFPDTDLAAIARGFGLDGVTVRGPNELQPVREWLDGPRSRALLIDAKVVASHGSWWLEEAFRGH
jgi:thiamine pyrophosphate-dependent acetolactate synthase large subunit-like protein